MSTKRNTGPKGKQSWATPAWFFAMLDERFGPFELDVCAEAWSAKCGFYFPKEADGLAQSWWGKCFCNPPFGSVEAWLEKGLRHARRGEASTLYVLPATTDTDWFFSLASLGQVEFVRGRINFDPPPDYEPPIDPKTGRSKETGNNTGTMLVLFEPGKLLEPHGELSGPLQSRCWSPKKRQRTARQEALFGG
jgi:phage N-6-adenine-methyltransferase